MQKSLIKALGIVAGLALSGFACAVSLGGINVTTALGEPLKAEIPLVTVNAAETNSLSAHLASPDAFKNAGVDFPYGLPLLTFQIEVNPASGEPFLKITSELPVNEPFVSLLVELRWSSGKLLREYTFLLDPPGYVVEQPKMAEVQLMEPVVEVSPPLQPPAEEVSMAPEVVSQPAPEVVPPAAAAKEPVEPEPVAAGEPFKTGDDTLDTVTVKRGDTLHKLATQVKPPEVSLERMLVALYRANADAFDGKNMNRLKTGKILQVPELADLENLQQAEAVQEIRVQAADWHAYRQKLATASKQTVDGAPKQEVSGKISTKVEDKTPATKDTAKEVVRLSKGESPGDKAAVSEGAKSAKDKAHTQQEEAIARNKAIQESNERVAMLEKNIKAMQRLAELKSQMAAEQAKPAEGADKEKSGKLEVLPKMAAPSDSSASGVAASSEVQQTMPKAKVVIAQPSILDTMFEQPLYLAGLAAALLGLLGIGYMRRKRSKNIPVNKKTDKKADASPKVVKSGGGARAGLSALFSPVLGFMQRLRSKSKTSKEAQDAEDEGSVTGRITAPVAPSPETGDFTKTLVSSTAVSHAPTDEVDPISEADLFLNFGRDEQAEEILKDALEKNPTNHLIHLKLLSIYEKRKDTKTFSTIAQQVKDSGNTMAWDQALAMGRKLDPDNPLYGGGGATPAKAAIEKTTAAPALAPEAGSDTMIDVGTVSKQAAVMDFDLGMGTAKMPAASVQPAATAEPAQDQTVVLNAPMDFDITGSHTNMTAASAENAQPAEAVLGDLVFDVTANQDAGKHSAEESEPETAPAEAEESISYLLDFPGITKAEPVPPQASTSPPLDIGLAEINLNLDEPVKPAPAFSAPAASHEPLAGEVHEDDVATKLDLAKAYQEMGDSNGAREILEEVVRDGNEQQRVAAKALLQELPA